MNRGLNRAARFAWNWRSDSPGFQEEELGIDRGDRIVPASLYGPERTRTGLSNWVVLHGITRPGRRHPTLLRFVRTLAGTGARVLVPEIPEWRELYLAPDEAVATILASVHRLKEMGGSQGSPVGVMGFSLGVGQVLRAAANPSLVGELGGVAGFGGYGTLDRTIHFLFKGEHEWEGETHVLDPDPYGRWIVGGNYLTQVPGYEDAEDVSVALLKLARKAGDLQVGSWEPFYDPIKDEVLEGVHPSRHEIFRVFAPPAGQPPSRDMATQLAPELAEVARRTGPQSEPTSFLKDISVPVRLVHGRGDRLIPFSESLRLAEAFPDTADVRVYLTNLFSHSQEAGRRVRWEVGEQMNFLRILTDLLALV
jgi:pimeloyl-ACP methyl ester carboxylesterase